jgi:hypothetical protein
MTFRSTALASKFAAISAAQLICVALASGQERVNPQAQEMALFSRRVAEYVALQKKVEASLPRQTETADPEKIKTHVASLANGIRAQRAGAKAGDIFDGAAEQFRQIIQQDAGDRSIRDAFATMKEVPKQTPPAVNADYPEQAALATVPPLILLRLQPLPEGVEYRFMGRDLILRDTRANLIVDVLRDAVPTVAR